MWGVDAAVIFALEHPLWVIGVPLAICLAGLLGIALIEEHA